VLVQGVLLPDEVQVHSKEEYSVPSQDHQRENFECKEKDFHFRMYDHLFISKLRENVPQIDFRATNGYHRFYMDLVRLRNQEFCSLGRRVFNGHRISFFSRDLKTSCNLQKEHSTLNDFLNAQPHQRSLAIGVARYHSSRRFLTPQRVCHSYLSKRATFQRGLQQPVSGASCEKSSKLKAM
jgi:hypothetical protein